MEKYDQFKVVNHVNKWAWSIEHNTENGTHVDFDVFEEFAVTFEGLGSFGNVSTKLKDDAVPVIELYQKVPFASYDKLKAELHKMEDM